MKGILGVLYLAALAVSSSCSSAGCPQRPSPTEGAARVDGLPESNGRQIHMSSYTLHQAAHFFHQVAQGPTDLIIDP